MLMAFVVMAIVGPYVAPYNPSAMSAAILAPPSGAHLLGTTESGQDVLSQLLVGSGISLLVGFAAGAIATVLSVVVGVAAGFVSGWGSEALSTLSNVFLVIPALPLVIVLAGYLPSKGSVAVAVVIAVTGWAWGARVLRVQTLSIRRREFVLAARAVGEPNWRLIIFEILPNEVPIIASSFLFTVIFAILTEAGLAFLGIGNVTSWSWGSMLYWAQNYQAFASGAWWWYVPPGACVALVGMALALVNFGIDEYVNPRLRAGNGR
jgi:peptide/nickel transport system permease protein